MIVLLSEMGRTGGETDMGGITSSVLDKLDVRGLVDVQVEMQSSSEKFGLRIQE